MRRIRVLQILEATIGGTKRHLLDLCSGLDPADFDVQVACPPVRSEARGDTSFVADMERAGIPVHLVRMVRKIDPMRDARALASLVGLVRRNRFDIIHSHSSKAGFLGRIAALADRNARVVYSPHGFYYLNFEDPVRLNVFKYSERIHRARTDRMITLSTGEYQKAVDDRIVERGRAALVENGIDHVECLSRDDARTRLDIAPDAVVVGTISRFTPQKAPLDLVAVARELVAADPRVVFVWISDGEMRSQVEAAIARYGLRNKVVLPGYVDEARRLIPAFDVFVLASRWEGLPYTIMEAMDAGVPIVATDAVGTHDVIDHGRTGLLVPPGRPHEIAKLARRLLTHPDEAAKIAKAARAEVSTRFSRAEMVSRIATLYRELVRDRVGD